MNPISTVNYTQGTGTSSTDGLTIFFSTVDPADTNVNYPIGKLWYNTTDGDLWILQGFTTASGVRKADWNDISAGSAAPLEVPGGGTGIVTQNAYAILCGGTTTTGPCQSLASIGSAGQVITSNGAGALPTWQGALNALTVIIQTFTVSGTYTPTPGMAWCKIELMGGGGGGGACDSGPGGGTTASVGGGGGSGQYTFGWYSAATIGASQTVTVGAAGAAGAVPTGTGGSGGNSEVGVFISSNGGAGGVGGDDTSTGVGLVVFGGIGGTGGLGGNFSSAGTQGGYGILTLGGPSTVYVFFNAGGAGGAGSPSYFSGGSGSAVVTINTTLAGSTVVGNSANGWGGGGGGAVNISTVTSQPAGAAGGVGGAGIVIITEYIGA